MMQLSPLGLVEKKTPGTYRIIHHLFSLKGHPLMMGYLKKTHVQYATIQDAIEIIQAVGPHSYCAKTDISNAFRIINVKESQYPLFGLCGKENITLIEIYKWVAVPVARFSRNSVLLLTGLLLTNYLFPILCTY
jgi:hypothetical protein